MMGYFRLGLLRKATVKIRRNPPLWILPLIPKNNNEHIFVIKILLYNKDMPEGLLGQPELDKNRIIGKNTKVKHAMKLGKHFIILKIIN